MKKAIKLMLCFIDHKWDKTFTDYGDIRVCKRCGRKERLTDLDSGPLGGQVLITEVLKGGD